MSKKRVLARQSVWDAPALLDAFDVAGIKAAHAPKLWGSLIRNDGSSNYMQAELPKAAHALLAEEGGRFERFTTRVVSTKTSADGGTSKLLLQLQDGLEVEVVVMHYDTTGRYNAPPPKDEDGSAEAGPGPASSSGSVSGNCSVSGSISGAPTGSQWGNRRATLCVSSQVGCQMGCTFCATGTMGLKGNLTTGEILEQLVHASRLAQIRNVVFMGMGEPMNNYDNVRTAVSMMTDSKLWALSASRVTVSTVGVIPRILQLARDLPGVSLALSLHAPTQELRQKIVPSARAYPLGRLMDAVQSYQAATGQRVFVEYVVLAGVNDGLAQAHELGALMQGRDVMINLIPWNPVYSPDGPKFEAPPPGRVSELQSTLRAEYGLACTIRQEKGQDIAGACGQLVVQSAAARDGGGGSVRDIEELGSASRAAAAPLAAPTACC